jgi:hypothetical protein
MTTIFAVIGSHRDDPDWLLLQGDDGRRYTWTSPESDPSPVDDHESDPDDPWQLDARADEDTLFI